MNTRAELDALIAQRDEVEGHYTAAVARLESEGLDHAFTNRRAAAALYDDLAALQKRIDAHLERERRGGQR